MAAEAQEDGLWVALEWALILIAVAGTACISVLHLVFAGHLFWMVANVGLVELNLLRRRWPYVVLFGLYLLFTVYGLATWER